ncbi:fibronectin type 3 and ankyrin repeat domains 1 protein-like [Patiria miniata]|uniref:Fibronectin type-III domain-containing protein n=1 Tax=Patiria miniata TaxID=46514 RepID=A0A914B4G8_PATMI|nr:fibronectin type 3 and ankyrin repeat domains 1 protein-like [Patiria miniata]
MSAPKKPDPPVVGKVTHYTIELMWDEAGSKDRVDKGDGRLRFAVQEADKIQGWGNVYTGYATSNVFQGLESNTLYKYRLRVFNSHGSSEYSRVVTVSTTKEPLNGDQLHKAVSLTQDVDRVAEILESGDVWVDVPDTFGLSPLMQASQKGNIEMIETLMRYAADINAINGSGKDSLMLACFAGHLPVVKLLRSYNASYETRDKGGSTAMHWAVDGGNVALIQSMIADGASVNQKGWGSGWTPLLRCAAMAGDPNVARVLINAGAEVNVKDKDGKTPLMIASLNGHVTLVQLLVEKGADPTVRTEFGMSAVEMAHSFDRKRVMKYYGEILEKGKLKKGIVGS